MEKIKRFSIGMFLGIVLVMSCRVDIPVSEDRIIQINEQYDDDIRQLRLDQDKSGNYDIYKQIDSLNAVRIKKMIKMLK